MRGVFKLVAALGYGGSGGYPAGVPAHHFDDGDEVVVAHGLVVEGEFADCRAKVFHNRTVAGAVVSHGKVVVYRFRNADGAHFVAVVGRVLGDFRRGILRVVAAYVEEEADVVRLEHFENAGEVRFFGELESACAERRGGGVAEAAHRLLRFFGQID